MFRIASLTAVPISVPLKKPVKMAGITVAAAENVVVRVTDEDGGVGWGEAASAPTMTGETLPGMVAAVEHMAPRLVGREVAEVAALPGLIGPAIVGNNGAKSAVEIALLDLFGRKAGQPLHALLGGALRERVAALAFLAGGTLDEEVAQARALVAEGYVALKVKIGIAGVAEDLARCRAIREAVGPGVRVSADANMGYGRDAALAFMAGAAEAGLDFVEQPVAAEDLEAMRACAEASRVPVAADEGLKSIEAIRQHHEVGVAGGSLKTIKLGGCLAVMEGGRLMERLGMRVNLAGKTAETSIASAAIAHLGVALPQLDWDASVTTLYLADDVAGPSVVPVAGFVAPPEGPGLGVEVDAARLERVRVGRG